MNSPRGYFQIDRIGKRSIQLSLRQGFTLIELLVAISIFYVIASLTGMTFYLLTRSERLVSQSFVIELTTTRLAEKFREDVHRSKTADVVHDESKTLVQLNLADSFNRTIQYRITKTGVARSEMKGDTVVHRDDFLFPDCQTDLVIDKELSPNVCQLLIKRPGVQMTRNPHAPKPLRTLEIRARLGTEQAVTRQPEPDSSSTDEVEP